MDALPLEPHSQDFFCFVRHGLMLFAWGHLWTAILLPMASYIAGDTDIHHHVKLVFVDMGVSLTLWPRLALNSNPANFCLSSSWGDRCEPPCLQTGVF